MTCWPYPGATFPIGTTTVTCSATDAAGNTVSPETSSVTVTWNEPDAAYRGGGGTLNDGFDARTIDEDQLIFVGQADDRSGVVDPVITLHLDGWYTISRIRIYGGQVESNALPGQLIRATVVIGDRSVTLETVPFGAPNAIGVPTGDILDLTGTALAGMATSTIVLRGFASGFIDQFPIAEITIDGTPAPADTTPPVVTISGATATYPVDARITSTATAIDAVDGPLAPGCALTSDATGTVPSTSCTPDLPAWSLGLGHFTFTATATDAAGNMAAASASFDVVATYPSVTNLTKLWTKKASVAKDLAAILDSAHAAETRGQSRTEANKLAEFRAAVRAQSGKTIDADMAALLVKFSYGL